MRQAYTFTIGSANKITWIESRHKGQPDLYVEISMDEQEVQRTRVVAQNIAPSWDEELTVYGDASSAISLSIKANGSEPFARHPCLGRVDTVLGTLLAECASDTFTAIELWDANGPSIGNITIKLSIAAEYKSVFLLNHRTIHCSTRFARFGNLLGLEDSIASLQQAVHATNDGDPEKSVHLSNLGTAQRTRFKRLNVPIDLENSIANLQNATDLTDDRHSAKPTYHFNLSVSQELRFKGLGGLVDLENCISNLQKAAQLTDDGHPAKSIYLSSLGNNQKRRFEHLGHIVDLEDCILNLQKVLRLTDDGHLNRPSRLSDLGINLRTRFECLGNLVDLDNSILNFQKAGELTDDGHPAKPIYLSRLANGQQLRFERFGNLVDLESSIVNMEKSLELTEDEHPNRLGRLSDLGITQQQRFKCLGNIVDLENSISNLQKASELADDGHPAKPGCLSNLGTSQQLRFEHLGALVDLEGSISKFELAAELTDDEHPDKLIYFLNLGLSQQTRFERLDDLGDLERSIANLQKAVQLTEDEDPNKPDRLSSLGISQQLRFERLGDLVDLESSIANTKKAIELTDGGHPAKSIYLSNLGISLQRRFEHLSEQRDLENAISNLEKAVEVTNNEHPYKAGRLSNLSVSQQCRYECLGNLTDLENSISNLQKAAQFTHDGHPAKATYLSNLGNSQQLRFELLGDPVDLDNSISNLQKAVHATLDGDPGKSAFLTILGNGQKLRFQRLGQLADLESSISNLKLAAEQTDDGHPDKPIYLSGIGTAQQTRFERLGEPLDLENSISNLGRATELTGDEHSAKPGCLSNLAISQQLRFVHLGERVDIENSIWNLQRACDLTDDEHPDKPMYLSNLSTSQQTRFKSLGVLVDVENSISNLGKAVELTDDGHPDKPMYLSNLGNSLHMRFEHLGERLDLVAAVCAFQAAAQSKAAYPRHALYAARKWAKVSHSNGDLLSALEGYRMALAILPKVAWLGLDTQSHQVWLTREKPEDLSCLSATCAIQLHLLEEAVELLDLGRSVFWQQASSLRGDLEMLREEEPELAEQLERVGHKLDSGTFAGSFTAIQSHITKFNGMEDAGRERRRLVGVWDELLERVRRLPKFEYFLQPKPFLQIQQAATTGQVIIINVSQYGVDALCFGPTGPIMHVPLANIDLDTLAQLSSDILLNRPISATASQQRSYTNHYLKPALRVVWNDILAPIFHKIHLPMERIENEKRRVWWYPTGPLTFIPIHAAGPGREALDVSHLVVSSYVTTLQSLSEAQKRKCQTSQGRLKLLAISQPSTPKQSPLPYAVEEVEKVTRLVISAGWSKENIVNLSGSDVTMDRVFSELETCSWAHFACHGIQDPVLGMKSAFVLHNGLLELYKIVSKRLSIGQFAFLSICDAASGLQDLPGEAMHLAAGLQFAGYQSIIATMWGISDDDAPKVADNVYHYLLRKGLQGLDPSEAVTALNHAVLCLRQDPTITVDRWAPFIHFGI